MSPTTRYARSAEVNIAYQVVGEGPLDLVLVPGWVSQFAASRDEPTHDAFLRRLASFSRLIVFDKRGTGLSDRVSVDRLPTLDDRMDDVRAVMDAAGSESAALFGTSEGGVMSALFAATYPQRTAALILYGTYAKRIRTPDYPWAPTADERERDIEGVERAWGGPARPEVLAPSVASNPRVQDWWARYLRASASPGPAAALRKVNRQLD